MKEYYKNKRFLKSLNSSNNDNNKWVDYLTEEQALKIGETRESIEKQCEDILGDKKYADEVFETVDWQSCNSYICELEDDF